MDPNRTDYYLLWKGRQTGPFSLASIREQLASGEISRMHQVSVDGRWMVLGEFLEQQDGSPADLRRRAEAAQRQAEAVQREEQMRREYEDRIAAERAQQTALQLRLADAEKRSTGPQLPRPPAGALPPQFRYTGQPGATAPAPPPPPGYGPPVPLGTGQADPLAAPHPGAAPTRTSGLAMAAFILSICNLVPFVNLVAWLLSIIFGHIALSQTDRDPTLGGRRLAIAGLIITYSLLAIGLLIFLIVSVVYGINLHRLEHH